VLAPLLVESDAGLFEANIRRLTTSITGGAAVCASLTDVLLYWDIRHRRPSLQTIENVLTCLVRHQALLPRQLAHQLLLRDLLVRVFGCDEEGIDINSIDDGSRDGDEDYWLRARCAVVGVADYGEATPYVDVARDSCRFLNRCEYPQALRSLCYLKHIHETNSKSEFFTPVQAFIEQASPYLDDVVWLYPSPELHWERALMTAGQ